MRTRTLLVLTSDELAKHFTEGMIRGLRSLLKGYRLRWLTSVTMVTTSGAARTAFYLLVGLLVDTVIETVRAYEGAEGAPASASLPLSAGAVVGLAGLEALVVLLWARVAAVSGAWNQKRLRDSIFWHTLSLPSGFFDRSRTGDLMQRLSAVRVVRAFARQRHEIEGFRRETNAASTLQMRSHVVFGIYLPATFSIMNAIVMAGMLLGGRFALAGALTVGSFVAYFGLARSVLDPFRTVGDMIGYLPRTKVSFIRVADIAL